MDDPSRIPVDRPITLPMADLLRLAEAVPLLDRLALLVRERTGEDRVTVIFGVLGGLQEHLDASAPPFGTRGAQETADAVRRWFEERIAAEEVQRGQ